MRQMVIAGNWKMNMTRALAQELLKELTPQVAAHQDVDIIICPPYTALTTVADTMRGTGMALGAQDMFWKDRGAYTGEISPAMLADVGCAFVIVGHSERRGRFGVPEPEFTPEILAHFGDTDATVNLKLKAALGTDLTPICCVGETLAERQDGTTDKVVDAQVRAALQDVEGAQAGDVIFAYEPVWAIGTGQTCDPAEANRVCGIIRETLASLYGTELSEDMRIQYGGSVNAKNAAELLAQPHIDGALVGGASLKAADFAAIIAAAPSQPAY